jgi:4-hydroxy-tetrahydrodipicolinate reductase
MRVGLYGFGKAGKATATVLLQSREVHLSWVIRKSDVLQHRSVPEFLGIDDEQGLIFPKDEWEPRRLFEEHPVDAIIDFSSAEAIKSYGKEAARRDIAIVTAISEYPDETVEFLKKLGKKTRVLWSPNITIGVNFMILAAKILNSIAPYTDIEIVEEHFKAKTGVSGTAVKIAHVLSLDKEAIKTIRAGGIVGRHEIIFGFPYQTVRLIHESITREAFGNGALFAVKSIIDKAPGLYAMEDLLIPYFNLK